MTHRANGEMVATVTVSNMTQQRAMAVEDGGARIGSKRWQRETAVHDMA